VPSSHKFLSPSHPFSSYPCAAFSKVAAPANSRPVLTDGLRNAAGLRSPSAVPGFIPTNYLSFFKVCPPGPRLRHRQKSSTVERPVIVVAVCSPAIDLGLTVHSSLTVESNRPGREVEIGKFEVQHRYLKSSSNRENRPYAYSTAIVLHSPSSPVFSFEAREVRGCECVQRHTAVVTKTRQTVNEPLSRIADWLSACRSWCVTTSSCAFVEFCSLPAWPGSPRISAIDRRTPYCLGLHTPTTRGTGTHTTCLLQILIWIADWDPHPASPVLELPNCQPALANARVQATSVFSLALPCLALPAAHLAIVIACREPCTPATMGILIMQLLAHHLSMAMPHPRSPRILPCSLVQLPTK
jgi:hypothetical protein